MSQTILIADDDPVVRHILTSILEPRGFSPVVAENGAAALELASGTLADAPPCAVFLDFFLGDMSGSEVLRTLQGLAHFQGIPVIMLSANTEADMRELDKDAHPDYYLGKPFKPEDVYQVLEKALSRP